MSPEHQIIFLTRVIKESDEAIAAFNKLVADGRPNADDPEFKQAVRQYPSYRLIREALKIKLINKRKFKQFLVTFLAMYRMDSKYKRDKYRILFRDLRNDLKELEGKQSQLNYNKC